MILINSKESFNELIPIIQKNNIVGFDVEGSSLDPYSATLLLVQLGIRNEQYVINVGKVEKKSLLYLFQLLKEMDSLCIGHNIKYDLKMIYHNFGILLTNVFDTMLAETLQMPGVAKPFHKFSVLVKKYCNFDLDKDIRKEFIGKTDFEFTEEQLQYAALDVKFLHQIKVAQQKRLDKNQSERVWALEMELEPVVAMMEYHGVLLDTKRWQELTADAIRLAKEYDKKIHEYLANNFDAFAGKYDNALEAAKNIYIPVKTCMKKAERDRLEGLITRDEIVGAIVPIINMNSHKQSLHVLQKLGVKTKTSNQKELQKFKGHEFISLLFKYREYTKAGTSFGKEFLEKINPVSGRIHSNFEQARAASGRFGSNGPNLQNIKKEAPYRSCFLAQDGYTYFTADYNQIELRIMAEVSKEPLMIEAFQNGVDLHRLTASIIFDKPPEEVTLTERNKAKNVNYAIIYGTTRWGLRRNFGWDLDTAQEYLDRYFDEYAVLAEFIRGAGNEVLRRKYSTTLYGRRRYFTLPVYLTKYDIKLLSKVKRQGVNHIIQGSSADMIKIALCFMFYENPFDRNPESPSNFRILKTVHDENAGEFITGKKEEVEEFIGYAMTKAAEPFLKIVPVEYDIKFGRCWRK